MIDLALPVSLSANVMMWSIFYFCKIKNYPINLTLQQINLTKKWPLQFFYIFIGLNFSLEINKKKLIFIDWYTIR